MSSKAFTRLPARRFGVIRRASVWDAGEYLLSVSGTTFSERYRRFYYRDIKAIVVQKGPRMGSIGAIVLLVWFCVPVLIALVGPGVPGAAQLIFLAPLALLLRIIYVSLARSCRVYIYTAVSSEEVPAIFRRRSAAKALPKILNKIAEAQGSFNAAPPVTGLDESVEPERIGPGFPASPVMPLVSVTEAISEPPSRQILYATSAFSVLFLVSAAFAYWYRSVNWSGQAVFTAKLYFSILNALEVAAGIWALLKLFKIQVMRSVRTCIFVGLGIMAFRTYMLVIFASMTGQRNRVLTEAFSNIGLRYWMGTLDCGLSLLVGILGLICLLMSWQGEPVSSAQPDRGGGLSSL